MRSFRPWLLLLALVSFSASAFAQQASTTGTSDPQAVALVQRVLAVLTGVANISDVTLTGTAHRIAGSDDETGTANLKATSAGDSRLDLAFPSGNRSEIRNSSATPLPGSLPTDIPASVAQTPQPVGAWSGVDGVLRATAQHNLLTDPAWFFPAFTLGNLASTQGYVLSFVGQENRNGQQVLHISASELMPTAPTQIASLFQHLSQMDLYLDPTSLLPVTLGFNVHPDNNASLDIPVEIQFSNYQTINGIQVPLHVQRYLNGGLVLDLQFETATLNSGLSPAAFQLQ